MRAFLDTNILLYAVLEAPADVAKRAVARKLIDDGNCAFSMQVFQEFYSQAIRPSRANALLPAEATGLIRGWRRFPVQETTFALFESGLAILRTGGFSFWDAMIVAAARAQGCEILYSEDMQDGRIIDGLRIVNPFR